jgi:hypothetical protein
MAKTRIVLFSIVALLVLVGCGANRTALESTGPIESADVVAQVQYLDGPTEGPMYEISMMVPEEWVGQFEVANYGNRIVFEYLIPLDEEDQADLEAGETVRQRKATVLWIDALSRAQYWEQIGSYPGDWINILFTADTYFAYQRVASLPDLPALSGLPEEVYFELVAAVPDIIASFDAVRLDQAALAQN